jgi:hypothetical protein
VDGARELLIETVIADEERGSKKPSTSPRFAPLVVRLVVDRKGAFTATAKQKQWIDRRRRGGGCARCRAGCRRSPGFVAVLVDRHHSRPDITK